MNKNWFSINKHPYTQKQTNKHPLIHWLCQHYTLLFVIEFSLFFSVVAPTNMIITWNNTDDDLMDFLFILFSHFVNLDFGKKKIRFKMLFMSACQSAGIQQQQTPTHFSWHVWGYMPCLCNYLCLQALDHPWYFSV